jgi:hypothetical protein
MNKTVGPVLCAALLVVCETSPRVEGVKHRHGWLLAFNSFAFDDRFSSADLAHTHVELPKMNIEASSIKASGSFDSKVAEVSLDILPVNRIASSSVPEYRFLILPYENFRHGAQQSSQVGGIDGVATGLAKLRFSVEDITKVIGQLLERNSVSIPNVMMPVEYLAAYGY